MTRKTSRNGTSDPRKPISNHIEVLYIASDLLIFILKDLKYCRSLNG
jgi:hypothetical protein